MPSPDIKSFIDTKPVSFKIKTVGGTWTCELHTDRHSLERKRAALAAAETEGLPSLPKSDSSLSSTSSSASSVSNAH
ncbi:hypothetical protein MN608_03505 [Microdochium nivale]|nr:hypothetical protein MN608_03505 [Microdochium nivale]